MYVAKRHTPHSCPHCGGYTTPHQVKERTLAGSHYWVRGLHFQCALKHLYPLELIAEHLYAKNPLYSLIKSDTEFQGKTYTLPLELYSRKYV